MSGLTSRGFLRLDFTDRNGTECSLQQSSIATEDCIWLGAESGTHIKALATDKEPGCYARMHLNEEQVRGLVRQLSHWLVTKRFTP